MKISAFSLMVTLLCHFQKTPPTSANSLWTLVSAPTDLPPPLAPGPAVDPDVRLVTFTIPPTLSPAPAPTSLTPSLCNAFYIGETHRSLSDGMNRHQFTTTVSNPDLPVAIRTQSHQIPFQKCWSVRVSYTNYLTPPQTTPAVSLKLHTNLSSNHDTTPVSISVNPPPTFHPCLSGI